jgi:hypothetical protein
MASLNGDTLSEPQLLVAEDNSAADSYTGPRSDHVRDYGAITSTATSDALESGSWIMISRYRLFRNTHSARTFSVSVLAIAP